MANLWKFHKNTPKNHIFEKNPDFLFFFIQIYLKLNNMNEKGGQMDQKKVVLRLTRTKSIFWPP